mmetsp:Transcript_7037/g.23054  ORF Transcript_7037/g.23054 Transcript_7037/m.23054 type:complete len:212 (-) Transcript_7037:1130-1765(-)
MLVRRVLQRASRRCLLSTTAAEDAMTRHAADASPVVARPMMMNDSWVAPTAVVEGDVFLADEANVWYHAVIRGDPQKVHVGNLSNVQERALLETVDELDSGFPAEVRLGDYVSVGAGSVLRSCTVGDNVSIGIGCVVQEGAVIEDFVKLEAGSVVEQDTYVPSGEKWAGNPAAFVDKLDEDDQQAIIDEAKHYCVRAAELNLQYVPLPEGP